MKIENILSEFETIEQDWKTSGENRIKKLPYENVLNNTYLGVDQTYYHFYIEIDEELTSIKDIALNEIFGYRIVSELLIENQLKVSYALNIYSKKEYVNHFSLFILQFSNSYSKDDPIKSIYKAQKNIRNFLDVLKKPLDLNAQKGLFGELYVLLKLAKSRSLNQIIQHNWQNQDENKVTLHDFIFDETDIEIKTTSLEPVDIHISSIQQLIPQENKTLKLIVNKITEDVKGVTLNDLVHNINQLIDSNVIKNIFRDTLQLSGYHHVHSHYYNEKFKITSSLLIHIDEKTPIIDPKILNDISASVFNIRYSLHIDSLDSNIIKDWADIA